MLKHLQYTLQDNFEKYGLWWIPAEPEKKVGGMMRFDPAETLTLELIGTLRPGGWPNPNNEDFAPEIIQGITSDGIEATLCRNYSINEPISWPGFGRQEFRSTYLLLGGHFDCLEEIQFNSYSVNYQYIEDWLFQRPYTLDVESGEGKFEYNIHWPSRLLMKEELTEIGGTFTLSTNLYPVKNSATALDVRSNAYLKWKPKSPQHFYEFRDLFFDIQHFFTLLFGESTFPRRIQGYVKDEEERDWPIAVFYNLSPIPSPTKISRYDMLVSYNIIGEQLPLLLDNWLLNADKLRPIYDLFFSFLSRPNMLLENRFLNLVHALESYHRVMVGGQYLPIEEYDEHYEKLKDYVAEIIPSTESGLRSALSARLKYGNEFSQRKRLTQIIEGLGDELRTLITDLEFDPFVDKVVDTRNELVHKGKSQNMGHKEMFFACQRLRILLTILLLQSLGLDSMQIKESIANNRRIQPWDIEG